MGVTIKDVAKRSGLSLSTVSRVLNNKDEHFAEETRQLVLRTVKELGYRINSGARAIRKGCFGCVALVLDNTVLGRSNLPQEMLHGLSEGLEQRGLHLTVACLPDQELTHEGFVPKILREWMADGMIINYNKLVPEQMVHLVESYNVPSVWLNLKRDDNCVYPDDFAAGAELTRRLLDMGHRRIAYVHYGYSHEEYHYSELDRRDGYVKAMRDAGASPMVIDRYNEAMGLADRLEGWTRLLKSPQRPTAVVAYGMEGLYSPVRAADRAGLRVPLDLSVATFSGRPIDIGIAVAHMRTPEWDVGRQAVSMLCEIIDSPAKRLPALALPFSFDAGESVAPPPKK